MSVTLSHLQQNKLHKLYTRHNISYLGLFGSVARGEAQPHSDVDVLVDFKSTKTLFDLAKIKIDLESLLGKKVDLALRG